MESSTLARRVRGMNRRARSIGVVTVVTVVTALLVLGAAGTARARPDDPFRAHGVEGAFVLLDTATGATTVLGPSLAGQRFRPCSTFKIPNTLIGLETGVITGERFSLRWDGVERDRAEWNRDQDLASAMKFSTVWFYQEVARRIGRERMTRSVRALNYGNGDVSGAIDLFWLDGPLAVSPREQVDFMRRLHAGQLPVKADHAALVLRLIELDRGDGWIFRGKTGQCRHDGDPIGWLVGSVERGGKLWVYALFLRGKSPAAITPLRRQIAEELLRRYQVLPAAGPKP